MTVTTDLRDRGCGPHCGHKDVYSAHCAGCHVRTCKASQYPHDGEPYRIENPRVGL